MNNKVNRALVAKKPIITLALTAVLSISFASCNKSVKNDDNNTVVLDEGCPECATLAFWWVRHDTINPALVRTAEPLWQFGRHDENMLDWLYQVKWHDECQKVLIHAYDSIHPGKNVKDKDMYMLDELIQFFDTYPDNSNIGLLIAYDLKEKFVTYKIVHYSKAIIDKQNGCLLEHEIKAWNEFRGRLTGVCVGKVALDWYGGSGYSAACAFKDYEISAARLGDVERLYKYYHNDLSRSQLLGKVPSNYCIETTIDSILAERKVTADTDHGFSDYEFIGYQNLYNEMSADRDSLIDAYYNWLSIRERLLGFDNKSAKKDKMIGIARELLLFEREIL